MSTSDFGRYVHFPRLSFLLQADVVVSVRGVEVPPGGIVLRPPLAGPVVSADVDGRPAAVDADGVTITACPANVVLRG